MGQTIIQKRVAEIFAKHPNAAHRTIAKALHDKYPELFPTVEHARTAARRHTGNCGNESDRRSAAKRGTVRAPRKPGELPPLPKSEAKPWEPYILNAKRTLVISDLHLPHHSEKAVEAALEYGDGFNPDCVLINGDLFDMYAISRHDKDPTKPKLLAELECGRQLFAHLRKRYPKARVVFRAGNHDERWDKYLALQAPLLFEIEEVRNAWHIPAGMVEHKIEFIVDRPIMLGKLPVFHGHELGRSIFSPVNPARGAFLRAHHTILVGHSHQTSGHADTNIWHDETFCWSTGCLCSTTPEYARVNRWNWGAATVEVDSDGSFEVVNFRITQAGKARKS